MIEKHQQAARCSSARWLIETSGAPDLLQGRGIDHEVLNAKQHQREAAIV